MLKDNLARKIEEKGDGFRRSVLSRKTGVPHETISQILRGSSRNPGVYTIAKLADALNCSIDELVDRQEFLENISSKGKQFLEYNKSVQHLPVSPPVLCLQTVRCQAVVCNPCMLLLLLRIHP